MQERGLTVRTPEGESTLPVVAVADPRGRRLGIVTPVHQAITACLSLHQPKTSGP
jgi:hypothetical protein